MNKLLESFKSFGGKWKDLSKNKKIIIAAASVLVLTILIVSGVYFTRVKYTPLFTNLETQDSAKIIEKLKSDKVAYKVEGNSILVPDSQVAELRMSVFSDGYMPSSQKGFELFDQGKFGVTDTEARVMYQRALEGELARTIESFDEVQKARVHLVLPEETVFAKDTEKARGSVILILKPGTEMKPEQVKAIIAAVSGSVKNLPRENIEVVDNNMNLLSQDLFNDITSEGTVSAQKQQEYERQFETGLQTDVKKLLEEVYGTGKVAVKVKTDLDFDSNQMTTIKYDTKDVVPRSMKKVGEASKDSAGTSGSTGTSSGFGSFGGTGSPTTSSSNGDTSTSNKNDETINNEIGQTEQKIVKAPGEVRRMTVSVLINGTLDEMQKTEMKTLVATATGFDQERGDQINISAMEFNKDNENRLKSDLDEMNKQEQAAKKMKLLVGIGIGALLAGILIALAIVKARKKRKSIEEKFEKASRDSETSQMLDVLVGEDGIQRRGVEYKPVLDDEQDDEMSLEKEIQNYATKKPDQVAEVIKTWLSEDER